MQITCDVTPDDIDHPPCQCIFVGNIIKSYLQSDRFPNFIRDLDIVRMDDGSERCLLAVSGSSTSHSGGLSLFYLGS